MHTTGAAGRTNGRAQVAAHFTYRNWGNKMKLLSLALLLTGSMLAADVALAQQLDADDVKWINQCIRDNKDEPGGKPPVIRMYCFCMNEKMDSSESRSISEWEKKNPNARKECDRVSGWR